MEYTLRQRKSLVLEADTTAESIVEMRDTEIAVDHAFLLAGKGVCVGTKRLVRPPTPPDTPTQAPTPGTNRRNAKYKRTIPLDHPRTA